MSAGRSRHARAALAVPSLPVDLAGLDRLDGDTLALFCFSDVRPLDGVAALVDWRLCGSISQALGNGIFAGADREQLLLPLSGRLGERRLFLFGLGAARALPAEHLRERCTAACAVMVRAGAQRIVLAAPAWAGDAELSARFAQAAGALDDSHLLHVLVER